MDVHDSVNAPARGKVYAVPRRYDLSTLFAVSLAYSLLFGGIRAGGGSPETFAVVAGFVTTIGLCQALLFRGTRPRLASVIGGVLFLVGVGFLAFWIVGNGWDLIDFVNPCALVTSALFGYVAGTLIGGVFLAADYLRRAVRLMRTPRSGERP